MFSGTTLYYKTPPIKALSLVERDRALVLSSQRQSDTPEFRQEQMEGVSSRLGRASARYGSTTVFSGPVRKWKKQWVQVSSSSTLSYQNSSQSNGTGNASALLLCRWTPISPPHTADSGEHEEPPRRKFRYTPIVVLEEQKKEAAKKVDDEAKTSKTDQPTMRPVSKVDDSYESPNIDNPILEENRAPNGNGLALQHPDKSHLDLSLCLKNPEKNKEDSDSENNEAQLGRVGSGGFKALH
ncbi:uncharacterized protein LOC132308393 [Cornus florida]|uniref:uncharacterized protein LOC132308393 n=1 Tax=Cornus florida TaxID=4283 RepID=UPI00289F1B2A|nr:uncharacterized protein LOC132308393 [Cornus florida]